MHIRHALLPIILLIGGCALPAAAKTDVWITLDVIEEANLVVTGVVTDVDDSSAGVTIDSVLDGVPRSMTVKVSPPSVQDCLGPVRTVASGEKVLLFLKDGGDTLAVTGRGSGKIGLEPGTRAAQIQAVKKLIQIARLADDDAKNKAMLAKATSTNKLVRGVSCRYVIMRLAHNKPQEYKDELVALLKSSNDDARLAALSALQYVNAPEAVPLLIKDTRDANPLIVQAASTAAAKYDTAQTVAALIRLTRQSDRNLRARGVVDLGNHSKRPEAKRVLIALMDDPDPLIRGLAAGVMVYSLRRNAADDALPKLVCLLNDSDDEVRMHAAMALGESRKATVIEPLLNALRTGGKKTRSYAMTVQAIYVIVSDDASARPKVQSDLALIVDALNEGDWIAPGHALIILEVLGTPEALAEIKKAAQNHPSEEIRSQAQRALSGLDK